MPIYDYKCRACTSLDEFGDPTEVVETIVCSMSEIKDRPAPNCPQCGEGMGRIWNQMLGGVPRSMFPHTFNDWGDKPVTCYDRHDMKDKMKLHDRSHAEMSEGGKYREKQMRKGRPIAINPSKA